ATSPHHVAKLVRQYTLARSDEEGEQGEPPGPRVDDRLFADDLDRPQEPEPARAPQTRVHGLGARRSGKRLPAVGSEWPGRTAATPGTPQPWRSTGNASRAPRSHRS